MTAVPLLLAYPGRRTRHAVVRLCERTRQQRR